MATYKTPDVYIKEISLFPPSVAEVETAVPAFIGYTEKAQKLVPEDLLNQPTKVTSLLDFQELFGGPPPVDIQEVVLDENNVVASKTLNAEFYMYDSLRLFFKNGGGKCYIISIGSYTATITKSHFETGLEKLKKKDEPTLILFPDAVLFGNDNLYTIQQLALEQCNTLQDRFCIFDLLESKSGDPGFDWEKGRDEFRDKIGINYLKYGAAYTPWLKTNLGITINYRDIKGKIMRGGQAVSLDVLTNDTDVQQTVTNLDNAVADLDQITLDISGLKGGENSIKARYASLKDAFKLAPGDVTFKALFNLIYDMVDKIDEWAAKANLIKGSKLITDIESLISNALKASMETLIGYDKSADDQLTGAYDLYSAYDPVEAAQWGNIFTAANTVAAVNIYGTGTDAAKMKTAEPSITLIFHQVNAAVSKVMETASTYETTYGKNLYDTHTIYKTTITTLSDTMTVLPPSGAIAGIYAMVDTNRGVWKAPANVSLSNVLELTETIDNKEQEDLNVDVTAGKSINAIRGFTGKGILVWGARTLAGNDNEWRYISVRRFFNMVEESIKKSTYWAVFEPNDANTWIKVKAMIENYLVQKWRDGALAGAKPGHAFFVNVGLGVTMTAQDILEGRMNVEIGMAVVRPAEFIILKFAHKMQES